MNGCEGGVQVLFDGQVAQALPLLLEARDATAQRSMLRAAAQARDGREDHGGEEAGEEAAEDHQHDGQGARFPSRPEAQRHLAGADPERRAWSLHGTATHLQIDEGAPFFGPGLGSHACQRLDLAQRDSGGAERCFEGFS